MRIYVTFISSSCPDQACSSLFNIIRASSSSNFGKSMLISSTVTGFINPFFLFWSVRWFIIVQIFRALVCHIRNFVSLSPVIGPNTYLWDRGIQRESLHVHAAATSFCGNISTVRSVKFENRISECLRTSTLFYASSGKIHCEFLLRLQNIPQDR